MREWKRTTRPLRAHHGWKAKPGMKLFVADKGAARFQIPSDWVIHPTQDCIRFYDREPPDGDCTIGFSLLRVPLGGPPVAELVEHATSGDGLDVIETGPVLDAGRPGLSAAWREIRHRDTTGDEAFTRTCIAQRGDICVVLTFDLWCHDAERVSPVWDEVLGTLELGRFVSDPTVGDTDAN